MVRRIIKRKMNELVGGDIFSDGNDRNPIGNKEIETGPIQRTFNDKNTDYQKDMSVTTDKVTSKYTQDIPWFAVYSYGGGGSNGTKMNYSKQVYENKKVLTKKEFDSIIEDIVKKKNIDDLTDKKNNIKLKKIKELINTCELSQEDRKQLIDLLNKNE